ncbi:hypothetical protein K501DRAFT_330553 [Backusella circina FSU 941]|nr:hypothetical protein K501DRAFT_330553 [Backusella circina FSU 941]
MYKKALKLDELKIKFITLLMFGYSIFISRCLDEEEKSDNEDKDDSDNNGESRSVTESFSNKRYSENDNNIESMFGTLKRRRHTKEFKKKDPVKFVAKVQQRDKQKEASEREKIWIPHPFRENKDRVPLIVFGVAMFGKDQIRLKVCNLVSSDYYGGL